MAKQGRATRSRKRVRKNIEKGQAHIASSFNNTMVTLTATSFPGPAPANSALRVPENPRPSLHKKRHKKRQPRRRNTA